MSAGAEDPFVPPGEAWLPISPKLARVRRLVMVFWLVVLAGVAAVALAVSGVPLGSGAVVLVALILLIWLWWLIGRQVKAYGYVERDEDLLVRSGILFRRMVIVPYGRMQLVDLVAGPIDRMAGLSTVQLHTAAATTDAKIPGLPPENAGALRDRLAARGEERSAGI